MEAKSIRVPAMEAKSIPRAEGSTCNGSQVNSSSQQSKHVKAPQERERAHGLQEGKNRQV
jgi:hypothetical protein